MSTYKRLGALLGVAVLGVALIGVVGAYGQDSQQQAPIKRVTFNMTAQHIGTGPSGQTPLFISVDKINTADERDALEEVFRDKGMQALASALADAPDVGFVRAPSVGTTGWRLHYARVFSDGKGGLIFRLATNRPISFGEAVNQPRRTWDYNVTLIELSIDSEGRGEGTLVAGAEFSYDETNDTFGLKSISSQPVRLVNVRAEIER
ncbi:MAG: hypothetical protein PVJ49_00135 [Acidobacteriota bacterium]|jgi:hypothetical protein